MYYDLCKKIIKHDKLNILRDKIITPTKPEFYASVYSIISLHHHNNKQSMRERLLTEVWLRYLSDRRASISNE